MPLISVRISDDLAARIDALPGSRSTAARGLLEKALGLEPSKPPKVGRPPKSGLPPMPPSSDPLHVQAANKVPKPEPPADHPMTETERINAEIAHLRATRPELGVSIRKVAKQNLGIR